MYEIKQKKTTAIFDFQRFFQKMYILYMLRDVKNHIYVYLNWRS